jgi:hypothetical protein
MNAPFRDLLASDLSDERRSIIDPMLYLVKRPYRSKFCRDFFSTIFEITFAFWFRGVYCPTTLDWSYLHSDSWSRNHVDTCPNSGQIYQLFYLPLRCRNETLHPFYTLLGKLYVANFYPLPKKGHNLHE